MILMVPRSCSDLVCVCCKKNQANSVKVAGVANVSVDLKNYFFHNMLGNIELNVDTTNNRPALTLYFANPSVKKPVLLEIPDFEMLMVLP